MNRICLLLLPFAAVSTAAPASPWIVDSTHEWESAMNSREGIEISEGMALSRKDSATSFEIRMEDVTEGEARPALDSATMAFE